MRVSVIGGGPGGLYFAILAKKRRPDWAVTVLERNPPADPSGFGIVLSDLALEAFARSDPESHARLLKVCAWWDDIEVRFKGEAIRIGGNGFCGCSRTALLTLLQGRAADLGVGLQFEVDVDDPGRFADSDLIVAADGSTSVVRETFKDHFAPSADLRPNRFVWLGSTLPLEAFTFAFRKTEFGIFIAHAYPYEAGRSAWVIEADADTFARAGLASLDEEATADFLERVFADDLRGHRLITNNSLWRTFPTIRNARWVKDNVVLLGDAKATAHFSVGSGTKLALEDAIALAEALDVEPSVANALQRFESERRGEVEKTQHAAEVSSAWFEHVGRYWDFDPITFAFGLMSRSKAITYDDLAVRAPEFVERATEAFAEAQLARGLPVRGRATPPMFQPFRLRGMELANRVLLSPMCMYSAEEGLPNDWHLVHLGARALGGAGLIVTEMTDVSAAGRISPGCAGLYTAEHIAAWARIVDFIHQHSAAKVCIQLGHAGRKGATRRMWEGMDQPLEDGRWEILSASPLPYFPHSPVPRAMTRADMDAVIADFTAAARRAEEAGFDMLELHCAHGYLLASFISPLTNIRTDAYGGGLANRLRFPLEVFRAVRAAWPAHKPMSVRISATDWKDGGVTEAESVQIAQQFAEAGCDLIDVSAGQTVPDATPAPGRMFQTPFSDRIRNEAGLATVAVGAITTADQINTILTAGRADLVALGRAHLADPALTLRAAAWYGVDLGCPPQYEPGVRAAQSAAGREREEHLALQRRARPGSGADALTGPTALRRGQD